jgi:hypothetical protein
VPTPGQPTLYKPEYCELAHNYCLVGATRRTLDSWIAAHPDVAGAVRRGRAVAKVVRACSFSHEVAQTTLYRDKEQTVTNTVSWSPDTQFRALCCFTGPKPHFRSLRRPKIRSTVLTVLSAPFG